VTEHEELFTIGQLAERTGLPVRTIRFWSDAGVVPPSGRSGGGYRLYDAAAVARLELVRTLRELGVDLETVERVVNLQVTVSDVARAHVEALDAQIRTLRLRRAVLRSVTRRDSSTEELKVMHDLARLSAQERQRMIDEFVDRAFDGIDPEAPGAGLARAMRQMPVELPDDPSAEQVDAWLELAELVGDPSFQTRVREMATAGAASDVRTPEPYERTAVMEFAGAAAEAGIRPESAEGQSALERIISLDTPAAERHRIADQVDLFTDRRVERYWHLMGILNDRPPFRPLTPTFEWLSAALRATG
jgi:DNA-binding transcriptional MerR regulator